MLHSFSEKLGVLGTLSIGILLFNASFYFGNLSTTSDELDALKQKEAELSIQIESTGPLAYKDKSQEHYTLPLIEESTHVSEKLDVIADKLGLRLSQASFRKSEENKQVRIEVTLPLKGSYSNIRLFLRDALALSPSTLDTIELHRSTRADPIVDTQIVLSYYFVLQ